MNDKNADDALLRNVEFLSSIGEMAQNPYLAPSLRRLLIDHARLGKVFFRPRNEQMVRNLSEAVQRHEAIIEAIEQRDSERASEAVNELLQTSRQHLASYVLLKE